MNDKKPPCQRCAELSQCPEDPMNMCGKPIGQYHCPNCGEMLLACAEHPKFCDEHWPDPMPADDVLALVTQQRDRAVELLRLWNDLFGYSGDGGLVVQRTTRKFLEEIM